MIGSALVNVPLPYMLTESYSCGTHPPQWLGSVFHHDRFVAVRLILMVLSDGGRWWAQSRA